MVRPADRVTGPVSNRKRVALAGQRHPLARAEFAVGRAPAELRMNRVVLVLQSDAAQASALEELIRAQHDPESPYFQQWITPEQFGERFGISPHDAGEVTRWLQSFGMSIDEIPISRRAIVFSGSAAQVEAAFHTPILRYAVKGATHYANAKDPEIPEALSRVVSGVSALHTFRSMPMHVAQGNYTAANGAHFLMPRDLATIYNVWPVYRQGLDGTGQSIAVLGRVNIDLADVRNFRRDAALGPNDPQIIVNGADPGFRWGDDALESALDVEWAGAIANNASVKFVTSKSGTSDGIALSAQYAVNRNVAPIISLSYGLCEASLGAGGNAFWNSTWAQAAAQGISVFVSSGDSGAAGCDAPSQTRATQGRAVNGLCSSPHSTCVGGTQFEDASNPSQYWSADNGIGQSSALGYIPEWAWNESGWSGGLWAGGGGASALYSKPAWQTVRGVPGDGKRHVPDVALHASIQDAYVVQVRGTRLYASGTSAATPAFASVMALVLENAGTRQGNPNPALYSLANQQFSAGGPSVFHDITSGNISVPGVAGFNAGLGYDEATGLGSIDAAELVNHWRDSKESGFALFPSVSSISLTPGGAAKTTLTLISSGFNVPAKLSTAGAPPGVTVKFSTTTISPSTPVVVTFTAATSAAAGTWNVSITGTGGGLSRSTAVKVTIAVPTFALNPSVTKISIAAGGNASLTVTSAIAAGFRSPISFSVSGLPAGVTAAFAPSTVPSPGSGSTTMKLYAATSAKAGTATVTLKGNGGGVTRSVTLTLTVLKPDFTFTTAASQVSIARGGSVAVTVSTVALSGFRSNVTLAADRVPPGVTATFLPKSVSSPGTGKSSLTLIATRKAAIGLSTIVLAAQGGGVKKQLVLKLRIK